jgi:hypothetical protein
MKKSLFLLLFICGSHFVKAQFLFSGYGLVSYNGANFFKEFRNYYNESNASTMKNKMGSPALGLGYNYAVGYRVLHLSTSAGRAHIQAKTKAEFQNNAKRFVRYEYDFTSINIGYFRATEKSEFSIEIGLLHSNTNVYVYAILPNKEKDFFTGISQQAHWVNLGGNVKFNYLRPLTDKLFLDIMAQGFYVNNKSDLPPKITLAQSAATLNYIGGTISVGLTLKLGKLIE